MGLVRLKMMHPCVFAPMLGFRFIGDHSNASSNHMRNVLFIPILLCCLCFGSAFGQNPWEEFPGARFVDTEFNDGDSFLVELKRNGVVESHVLRLYFVDCPETVSDSESDRKRVLEQMRYFGVESPSDVLAAGEQARAFVAKFLSRPFLVKTAFASALGRSKKPRIYSLITNADGRDLEVELVKAGLARAKGVSRALPDGTAGSEHATYLSDLEAAAMLGRKGIWKSANPDRIAELRSDERREARTLNALFDGEPGEPVNLNQASLTELQKLPGVGSTLAKRIVENRPFQTVEEVTRVNGISSATVLRWEGRAVVAETEKTPRTEN